ncbi:LysR family transcriptional regulator [Secundilactobacillus folii]|uniref:LysR family transcriptional regulator n=1 Tax=Secundilactobacillus folii TaxID=2678357 RepID=A0A7X2XWZ2_9LACO|nr:LysR family transcriptional regulator [Secundilactobacillus folii]MTV81831.1 LysR family transcriptional regulator [Secundilactobacillus folii]
MSTNRTLLHILKTVDYSQTISDIANRLYLSQPYISKLLKETESRHHVVMVKRSKPIELTEAGRTMIHGLQSIVDEEDRLNENLTAVANPVKQPIKIGVTDPFISGTISEAMTDYYVSHDEQRFSIRMLTDLNDHQETMNNTDILIGRRLTGSQFEKLDVPNRQLSLFVTNHCRGYQPEQLYQKFSPDMMANLDLSTYVGLAGCNAFECYVDLSFRKENIDLIRAITVPTAADALRTVDRLPKATTITTLTTAKQVFPELDFNLIPLPASFISLETSINYRQNASANVIDTAAYLQRALVHLDAKVTV